MDTNTDQLVINEIYASVQGESTHAGLPCVFVRLTGCNLRCTYCDTEYAFYEGTRRSVASVVEDVLALNVPMVEITGGEPLLQKACVPLTQRLLDHGLRVLIETSGERPIHVLPKGVIRIMDLKCPSSGECERNNWENIAHLTATDEVKFVIGDRADYEWSRDVVAEHQLAERCPVLFSPVHGTLEPRDLAEWIIADRLPVRLQLQMHKYVWDPKARGV